MSRPQVESGVMPEQVKRISAYLTPQQIDALRARHRLTNVPITAIVRQAIQELLSREEE